MKEQIERALTDIQENPPEGVDSCLWHDTFNQVVEDLGKKCEEGRIITEYHVDKLDL